MRAPITASILVWGSVFPVLGESNDVLHVCGFLFPLLLSAGNLYRLNMNGLLGGNTRGRIFPLAQASFWHRHLRNSLRNCLDSHPCIAYSNGSTTISIGQS
jgi:hypothetical protein